MSALSVILHIDLDCFYAQVERERLHLPADACVAVVQWSMALAVSYPARKFGIKRGSSVEDIRRLAGDAVTIVPVETIAAPPHLHPSNPHKTDPQPPADVQATEKVSLARYRNASASVFAAISDAISGYKQVRLERASIDEAYVDVSAEVDRRYRGATERTQWPEHTVVIGDKLDLQSETDARLAHGAVIAREVRARVFETCKYTMSAGISVNKLLSKFASARNKPNKQTILPMAAVPALMSTIPLRKLRGLGGKLGHEIEVLGAKTAGEATLLTMNTLENKLGSKKSAEFVYKCVRGIDETEVAERDKTKSILAAKNFKGEMSLDTVKMRWLPLLASEIAERMDFDSSINGRDACTLTVSFRVRCLGKSHDMVNVSRSVPMPPAHSKKRDSAIVSAALSVLVTALDREKQFSFPINFIGLTAVNFRSRATEKESINSYFSSTAEPEVKLTTRQEGSSSCEEAKKHEYQRRLQERSDRELALRLHRQECGNGISKKRRQKPDRPTQAKKNRGRADDAKGLKKIDSFFKSATG